MNPNAVAFAAALAACAGSALAQTGLDLDRAYASQMRADAETRASFLGLNARPNVDASVVLQARYMASLRDERSGDDLGDDDTTLGFDVPRAQLRLSGRVTDRITGHVRFDFGAAESGDAGTATLLDAFAAWELSDQWTLRIGQWQSPLLTEDAVDDELGLAVETSVANAFFSPGYTQGVGAERTGDNWKFFVGLSDGAALPGGADPANSGFDSPAEADWAVTARADLLVSGTWDQFDAFTSWRGSNTGLRLGVGGHFQQHGRTNPSAFTWDALGGVGVEDVDMAIWTVDASYHADGWNLYAAYLGNHVDASPTVGDLPSFVNHGVVVQGGVFVSDQVELFGRYDALYLDSDLEDAAGAGDRDLHFVTAGLNYYLVPESHAARFTADAVYSFSDTGVLDALGPGGAWDAASTGLLGVSDGELLLRAQLTLVF